MTQWELSSNFLLLQGTRVFLGLNQDHSLVPYINRKRFEEDTQTKPWMNGFEQAWKAQPGKSFPVEVWSFAWEDPKQGQDFAVFSQAGRFTCMTTVFESGHRKLRTWTNHFYTKSRNTAFNQYGFYIEM